MGLIAGATRNYSWGQDTSRSMRANRGRDLVAAGLAGDDQLFADEAGGAEAYLSSIIGDSLTSKIISTKAYMIPTDADDLDEYFDASGSIVTLEDGEEYPWYISAYMSSLNGASATKEGFLEWANGTNASVSASRLSGVESDYVDMLISNSEHGISGLTPRQLMAGAAEMMQYIDQGKFSEYLLNDASIIDTYSQAYSNLPAYSSMAQIVEGISDTSGKSKGYKIRDLVG